MKKLLFLFFITKLLSQEEEFYAPELYIFAENFSPNQILYFKIEEVNSTTFCNSNWPGVIFQICSSCSTCGECLNSHVEDVPIDNNGNSPGQRGWGICSWKNSTAEPYFGWGIYKITYLGNHDYFYIDFRDDNYAIYGGSYGTDVKIYYIDEGSNTGHFEWLPVWIFPVNLQLTLEFGAGWNSSISWFFNSGLPFTQILGYYEKMYFDQLFYSGGLYGHFSPYTILADRNLGRLPTYHRLDVSIYKRFQLDFMNFELSGSIMNVYDRKNIFYYERETGKKVNMLPILPTATVKIEI